MRRTMMKSKLHRATVAAADLNSVDSISLDSDLMARARIVEWEQVDVLDIDNGARFQTYAIRGGAGDVIVNGAAARLVQLGDRIIIIAYAHGDPGEFDGFRPAIVHVDDRNRAVSDASRLAPTSGPSQSHRRLPTPRRRPQHRPVRHPRHALDPHGMGHPMRSTGQKAPNPCPASSSNPSNPTEVATTGRCSAPQRRNQP
ncbi:MAG: aspartate 1-decarboxylase [Actinomycetota bacterium]